jgi:hypothetical protein
MSLVASRWSFAKSKAWQQRLATNKIVLNTRRGENEMTIDERLEALTRNLELLSLESEKHDRQLDRAAKLVTEVAEGTARLLQVAEMHGRF